MIETGLWQKREIRSSPLFETIVIGGGQSGLAAGYHLKQAGVHFAILEAGAEAVGSWPHYYDSLHLFSPARYSALPGLPFPGEAGRYPGRDDVIDYLRRYARHFELPVYTRRKVTKVTREGNLLRIATTGGDFQAYSVIVASGAFNQPFLPTIPGRAAFTGQIVHAFDYRNPSGLEGKRIVVVGAGNSAVQIAAELANVSSVTLATREPPRFIPQQILGRDIHFWLRLTGLDYLPDGNNSRRPIDSGGFRRMLSEGKFERRPMFERFWPGGVVWADGTVEEVDVVILATGYRPNLGFLEGLIGAGQNGKVAHADGLSLEVPGLYFVGLAGQRNLASATLRGSGPDSACVVKHLRAYLRALKSSPLHASRDTLRSPWAGLKSLWPGYCC